MLLRLAPRLLTTRLPPALVRTVTNDAYSGAGLSSEATAIDEEHLDAIPDDELPPGANRTPGPPPPETITMSVDRMHNDRDVSFDYPTGSGNREIGSAAADPHGPADASSMAHRPPASELNPEQGDPSPESQIPPSGQPGSMREAEQPPGSPPHPPMDPVDPSGGMHLS